MDIRLLAELAALVGLIMSLLLIRYDRRAWFVVVFWVLELVSREFWIEYSGYCAWIATVVLCLITLAGDWRWGKVAGK